MEHVLQPTYPVTTSYKNRVVNGAFVLKNIVCFKKFIRQKIFCFKKFVRASEKWIPRGTTENGTFGQRCIYYGIGMVFYMSEILRIKTV